MMVAGIMSGTSADGINVAFVRLTGLGWRTRFNLLGHRQFPYSATVRQRVLSLMNTKNASVAELARLNVLLGELYAEAVLKAQRALQLKRPDLIGSHGQTLYHQAVPTKYLGKKIATTWQTGEAAIIAARTGVPVASDFRPADMAAGGQGAPLVPFLDYMLFRHPRRGRIVQNLGGIANLTAIPAGASTRQVLAFDTGPGNMVIDGVMQSLYAQPYDRNGAVAARGGVLHDVVSKTLNKPFFLQSPPRSTGREQFADGFIKQFISQCNKSGYGKVNKEDIVATATALTAASIAYSINTFLLNTTPSRPRKQNDYHDFVLSGGGTKNRTLMRMLHEQVMPLGLTVHRSDEFGLPSEAKEAAAFALLAYHTWHYQPSNLPSATGARKAVVLGKISLP